MRRITSIINKLFQFFVCYRPTPDYSWTFTGLNGTEILIMSGQNGYELQDFNHILTVRSVGIKHGGWYTCKVSSDYGGVKHTDKKKAKLSVKGL